MVLYGIVGTLFSYCVTLIFKSPLAAFSAAAGYGVVMFVVSRYMIRTLCLRNVLINSSFIQSPTSLSSHSPRHLTRRISSPLLVRYLSASPNPRLTLILDFIMSVFSPVASVVGPFIEHLKQSAEVFASFALGLFRLTSSPYSATEGTPSRPPLLETYVDLGDPSSI